MTAAPKLLDAFKAGATFALSVSAPTDVAQEEAFKEWLAEVSDPLYGEKMDCLLAARLGMDQASADQTTVPCACEAEGDTLNVRRQGDGRVRGICAACGFQAVE